MRTKPGTRVAEDAAITVKSAERYVGRGGLKLEAALAQFGIDPAGRDLPRHRRLAPAALPIACSSTARPKCTPSTSATRSSTGKSAAIRAWSCVKSSTRATSRAPIFPTRSHICVIDVSFISLTLILPPAVALLSNGGVIVPLIKPQFELRKEDVGRGGVVRDAGAARAGGGKDPRVSSTGAPGLAWAA